MIEKPWVANIERNFAWDVFELRVGKRSESGGLDVVTGLTMESKQEGSKIPPVKLDMGAEDFLREIVRAAWDAGIRPPQMDQESSELKATKYHLEDMRKLAKVKD